MADGIRCLKHSVAYSYFYPRKSREVTQCIRKQRDGYVFLNDTFIITRTSHLICCTNVHPHLYSLQISRKSSITEWVLEFRYIGRESLSHNWYNTTSHNSKPACSLQHYSLFWIPSFVTWYHLMLPDIPGERGNCKKFMTGVCGLNFGDTPIHIRTYYYHLS